MSLSACSARRPRALPSRLTLRGSEAAHRAPGSRATAVSWPGRLRGASSEPQAKLGAGAPPPLSDSSVRLLLVFRLHSVAGGGERKETPSLHPGFPHQWVNTAPFPTRRKAVGGPRGELRGELASPRHCVTHFVSREQTLWWKETTKWNWPDAKGLTPPEAEQATETDGAAGPQRGVTRGCRAAAARGAWKGADFCSG